MNGKQASDVDIDTQMDEFKYFQTSAEQVREAMPLPDVPVVIITHGKKV